MKNSRQFYTIYAEPLFQFWKTDRNKRKLEELYSLLGRLYLKKGTDESRFPSTVKNYFIRENKHILPVEYLPGVSCLLLETDFYQNFIYLTLPHRLDSFSSDWEIKRNISFLSYKYESESESFWFRWIDLLVLYLEDLDKLKLEKWDHFFDRFSILSKKKYFEREMKIIKNSYSEDLANALSKRESILQNFFLIVMSYYYISYLNKSIENNQETNHQNTLELSNVYFEKLNSKSQKAFSLAYQSIEFLHALIKNDSKSYSVFGEDLKIIELILKGTELIVGKFNFYSSLDLEQKEQILNKGKKFLADFKLEPKSTMLYQIYYLNFEFLHLYRILLKEAMEGSYINVIKSIEELIIKLNQLEKICHGGFININIKILKYKKIIYNLRHEIKIRDLTNRYKSKTNYNDFYFEDFVTPWEVITKIHFS
jgi:hypothetical protein